MVNEAWFNSGPIRVTSWALRNKGVCRSCQRRRAPLTPLREKSGAAVALAMQVIAES
jgi:hypothetical protein